MKTVTFLCSLLAAQALAGDFTLTFRSGEVSKDSSSFTMTYEVKGKQVTISTAMSGRHAGMEPKTEPRVSALKDLAKIDAALAAVRKTADDQKKVQLINTQFQEGCLTEGTRKLCSTLASAEGTTERLTALHALEQAVLSAASP